MSCYLQDMAQGNCRAVPSAGIVGRCLSFRNALQAGHAKEDVFEAQLADFTHVPAEACADRPEQLGMKM